jgi:hypothetical protein
MNMSKEDIRLQMEFAEKAQKLAQETTDLLKSPGNEATIATKREQQKLILMEMRKALDEVKCRKHPP